MEHPETSITIDASCGEVRGETLRMSLALSSLLSCSVRIDNIRENRSKPGLLAQHLTGAELVARITQASLVGAVYSSKSLSIGEPEGQPSHVLPLRAEVGTAGSIALVLQAALPAALRYLPSCEKVFRISGGTTAMFAPVSEYVTNVFVPNLKHFGVDLIYNVVRHGFFPQGGGICEISFDKSRCEKIREAEQDRGYVLQACNLTSRGHIISIKGTVLVCGEKYVRAGLAEVMRAKSAQIVRKFCRSEHGYPDVTPDDIYLKTLSSSEGTGDCLSITIWATASEGTVLGGSAIWTEREASKMASDLGIQPPRRGAQGDVKLKFWQQTAAHAGELAANELCDALQCGAVVDSHMADQLCIFMAMASGTSRLLIPAPTLHVTAVLGLFQSFGIEIRIEDIPDSQNKLMVCAGRGVSLTT